MEIVIAGGTMFKQYNPASGELSLCENHSNAIKIINDICCKFLCNPSIVCWGCHDSLNMTEKDRDDLVNRCLLSPSNEIIVIHGTDTLHLTQKTFLDKNIKEKKIILTGAFIPACCKNSDASFNLGFALGCLNGILPGIYVAMNGFLFDKQVKKIKEKSIFDFDK